MRRAAYVLYFVAVLAVGVLFGLLGSLVVIAIGAGVIYLTGRNRSPSLLPILTSSVFRTGNPQLDDYISSMASRLSTQGFKVDHDVEVGSQKIALLATRSRFEITKLGVARRVVAATGMDMLDEGKVENLMDSVTHFSGERSLAGVMANQSDFVYVVIASPQIGQEMKEWVEKSVGKRRLMGYTFPVLASLAERKIYFPTKTPAFGAAFYSGIRKFAAKNLAFSSSLSV